MTRAGADRTRSDALAAFLIEKRSAGYEIESQTATQAIIVRRRWPLYLLSRLRPGTGQSREVVSVDEAGRITSTTAEPRRW